MDQSYLELSSRPGWTSCNIQQIANRVQKNAEEAYNTTFEIVVGVGDYASKSHFYSDLICKIEVDGKFVLAYATPRPDAEDADSNAQSVGSDSDTQTSNTALNSNSDTQTSNTAFASNSDSQTSNTALNSNSENSENSVNDRTQYSDTHHGIHRNHVWRF